MRTVELLLRESVGEVEGHRFHPGSWPRKSESVHLAVALPADEKDYERKVQTSETLIEVAMIRLLVARLRRMRAQTCSLAPGAGSTLTCGYQAVISEANHPVRIPECNGSLGELLPELGLVLLARRSHDHVDRC